MTRLCEVNCGRVVDRPLARFCPGCRAERRRKSPKYPLSPERETYLRAHYRPTVHGISHRIARVLGVPKWRVCRWAAELGLSGPDTRGPKWTTSDDAFLEAHIGARRPGWIAKQLGRSVTAVTVRAKRIGLSRRDARTWYTARQVADGFGVDPSTVVRWIDRAWLAATREGQDYPDGRAAAWRVEYVALRRFVREHHTAYLLAKVDQVWFLDLVFGGLVEAEEGVRAA